jgi:hypothetical protein
MFIWYLYATFVAGGLAELDGTSSSNLAGAGGEGAAGGRTESPAPPNSPGETSSRMVLPRPRGVRSGGGTIGMALLCRFWVTGRGAIFCSSVL